MALVIEAVIGVFLSGSTSLLMVGGYGRASRYIARQGRKAIAKPNRRFGLIQLLSNRLGTDS